MRASVNPHIATAKKRNLGVRNSTAWYLFDKENRYLFKVDNLHFRAKNRRMNDPLVSNGSDYDMMRIGNEMIHTAGTIMEMVDYFIDGANIQFHDYKVPEDIYQRIGNHLEAHLEAMRTDIGYRPPAPDDFRHLAEFALAIRTLGENVNKQIDADQDEVRVRKMFPVRARFSDPDEVEEVKNPVPRPIQQMDAIERFIDMINR